MGVQPAVTTCLVVDGHDVVREGLRLVLARAATIELLAEASDHAQAVALAAALRPDVVLLDPALPGGDGFSTLRRIVAASPSSRVVLFSRLANPELLSLGRAVGASGFVVKDSGAATIARALTTVSAGGEFVDPQLEPGTLGLAA